jgi:hypothetical protein
MGENISASMETIFIEDIIDYLQDKYQIINCFRDYHLGYPFQKKGFLEKENKEDEIEYFSWKTKEKFEISPGTTTDALLAYLLGWRHFEFFPHDIDNSHILIGMKDGFTFNVPHCSSSVEDAMKDVKIQNKKTINEKMKDLSEINLDKAWQQAE